MKKIVVLLCFFVIISCSSDKKTSSKVAGENADQPVTIATQSSTDKQKENIFVSFDPRQTNELIQNNKDLLILDVRNPPELKEGAIKGSTLVPFWDIAKGRYKVPTDKPILLVCAVGGRSFAVGKFLAKQGYPEVYNLKGGISSWKKAGLPVEY